MRLHLVYSNVIIVQLEVSVDQRQRQQRWCEDQVGHIIYLFESEFMQSWIKSDSARLISLTFGNFMLEVKWKWLPSDWEDKLIQELIAPQGDQEFYEWSVSIRKANNKLEAADSLQHIPANHFHAHLIAHLNPALHLAYHATKKELDAIEDIEAWIHCIIILDIQLTTHQKQISTSMANAAKNAAKAHSNNHSSNTYTTLSTGSTTNATAHASMNTATPLIGFVTLPKLTQVEKDLLDLHQGCYKCSIFYAGHFLCACTGERPTLETCKKVTPAGTLCAKAAFDAHNATVVGASA